jgi:hypothetical protein
MAEEEVLHWSRQVMDSVDNEKLDAQRAIYIDYLLRHSE